MELEIGANCFTNVKNWHLIQWIFITCLVRSYGKYEIRNTLPNPQHNEKGSIKNNIKCVGHKESHFFKNVNNGIP